MVENAIYGTRAGTVVENSHYGSVNQRSLNYGSRDQQRMLMQSESEVIAYIPVAAQQSATEQSQYAYVGNGMNTGAAWVGFLASNLPSAYAHFLAGLLVGRRAGDASCVANTLGTVCLPILHWRESTCPVQPAASPAHHHRVSILLVGGNSLFSRHAGSNQPPDALYAATLVPRLRESQIATRLVETWCWMPCLYKPIHMSHCCLKTYCSSRLQFVIIFAAPSLLLHSIKHTQATTALKRPLPHPWHLEWRP